MPALTLNVNNFIFLILKQTLPDLATFPKIYLAIWYGISYLGPTNLTFPWQPYFDRHVFRNFDLRAFLIRITFFSLEFAHFCIILAFI